MKTILQEPIVPSSARVCSAVFISSLKAFLYTSTRTGHRKIKEESRQHSRKQKQQPDTINIALFFSNLLIPFKASPLLGYKRKIKETIPLYVRKKYAWTYCKQKGTI